MNFTKFVFIVFSIIVTIISLMIHLIENYLPIFIKRSFRYGKYSEKADHIIVKRFEVPKRWFAHFYIFAGPISSSILLLLIWKMYTNELPNGVHTVLDLLLGTSRQPLVSPGKTLLAITLVTAQCWKRFYETQFVNIFSDSKMNIVHYIVGFTHYVGVLTCIIGESYGFTKDTETMQFSCQLNSLDLFFAAIFCWASYEQLNANRILANLRKNKKEIVNTQRYAIPRGRLFEYISAPLQFTEIIMYLMLTMILWKSSSYHYVSMWVFINQTETGISTHRWYIKTFRNYPRNRKAYIPFLL